jgi:hypothetical protein
MDHRKFLYTAGDAITINTMEGSQNVRIELLYDLAIPPLGV